MEKRKIYVVTGPTASGKSDFAVTIALRVSGEIVSVDSRQMYQNLDIGSGKITKEDMKGIPHHMLSIYDVRDEMVSVSRFVERALVCIEHIYAKGKVPILCGGTGMYLDALLYEKKFPEVEPNKTLRKELEKLSTLDLSLQLKEKDIRRYNTIDTQNKARLIRALEICEALGTVPAESVGEVRFDATIYLIEINKPLLNEKIKVRLEKRLEAGMVNEVVELLANGVSAEKLISLGLEYKYITLFILGTIDEQTMKKEILQKSIQYAKRQMTWNTKYVLGAEIVKVEK